MKLVFWISLALIAYAYAGYPLLLYVKSRWRSRPTCSAPLLPDASIIMAVHNEAHTLPEKLRNLFTLDYPPERLEIIVVSDGSTDATNEMLGSQVNDRLHIIILAQHEGKAAALNRGVEQARGEVLVFTDARQMIEPEALRYLMSNFADPRVGCVSGELMFRNPGSAGSGTGIGLYWRLEKKLRNWEGLTGSVVGATGAFYAVRRKLAVHLPDGLVLDDVYMPLQVVRQHARVILDERARAWDRLATPQREFSRKVRTLTGNYQLLQLLPWLLSPANPVLFEFFSHKLLRLFVPFALAGLLVSSLWLPSNFYRLAALLQFVFYGLSALAFVDVRLGLLRRLADVSLTFIVLNTAAVVAFVNFITGKKVLWSR